jgi:regulator of protease activity HflC (stomatin/prohibitin superfamily)
MNTVVTVSENERVLVLKAGRFVDILRPGRHQVAGRPSTVEICTFSLLRPEFVSEYVDTLIKERPDLAQEHLTEVRTDAAEVAVIFRDGRLYAIQGPDGRSVFLTDAGPFEVERFDVSETLEVPKALGRRLGRLATSEHIKRFNVADTQKGLFYVDGVFERVLEPGAYAFFDVGRVVSVRTVDVRRQAMEVGGQEMLTKDRVTIRVNVSAEYRVIDPVKAVTSVADFEEALYRALQFAFRKSLGTKTLDEILGNKVDVDAEAAEAVRSEMAQIGIEVGEIALKDVILPGEMREILNQVVSAEKEAQANNIRRREETAATRSLLNTAKVMQENPIMLRLKELEALETISERVGYLTVHNGTQGLLEDLVKLREDPAK